MGPLDGVKVVELAGIGPGPHCCMLLADMGADVLRVSRLSDLDNPLLGLEPAFNLSNRNRPDVALDLKHEAGHAAFLRLVGQADILIEGFRPGVIERLGLGPELLLASYPSLVIGRMTGWGQTGPLAGRAGHDINYIALSGALSAIGDQARGPAVPLNLVGDYGGGALYLAMGVLAAHLHAMRTGQGQIVDASMVEGSASLMTLFWGLHAAGLHNDAGRGENMLDGGAFYYGVYRTRDGKHLAVGALEPQFFAELIHRLGLRQEELPGQFEVKRWEEGRTKLQAVFETKSQAEWMEVFADSDACVSPVLTMSQAMEHPQNRARGSFVEIDGIPQPAPSPRFSKTPTEVRAGPSAPGAQTRAGLACWGFGTAEIAALEASGAIKQSEQVSRCGIPR